jgi:hypothetical protein
VSWRAEGGHSLTTLTELWTLITHLYPDWRWYYFTITYKGKSAYMFTFSVPQPTLST